MKEIETTNNKRVYKLLVKKQFSCSICPPNKGENTKRRNQYHKKHRCWKLEGKKKRVKKQYMGILV